MEQVLQEVGDCGLFQVWVSVATQVLPMFTVSWGTAFVAFGNYNPGMRCHQGAGLSAQGGVKGGANTIAKREVRGNFALENSFAGGDDIDENYKDDDGGDNGGINRFPDVSWNQSNRNMKSSFKRMTDSNITAQETINISSFNLTRLHVTLPNKAAQRPQSAVNEDQDGGVDSLKPTSTSEEENIIISNFPYFDTGQHNSTTQTFQIARNVEEPRKLSSLKLPSIITQEDGKSLSCDAIRFRGCDVEFFPRASTIVTEWKLVCDRSWIASSIMSAQMSGLLVGAVLSGYMGDPVGRKKGLYGHLVVYLIGSVCALGSHSWQMLAASRFVIGFGIGGATTFYRIYPLEFLNQKWRRNLVGLPIWNTSLLAFIAFAYAFPNWRDLLAMNVATALLSLLPVICTPESLRWLAVKGKKGESVAVLRMIARMNGKPSPSKDTVMQIASEGATKVSYSYFTLFRRGLRTISFSVTFVYISQSLIFYTIFFGVQSLSGNFFLNFALMNLIGFAKAILMIPAVRFLGRRFGGALLYFITAALCMGVVAAYAHAPEDVQGFAIRALALTSTVTLGAAWSVISLFCAELYPTVMRTLAGGLCNSAARIGGILAPFLVPSEPELLPFSFLVMTVLALTCSAIVASLPETSDRPMEDFLEKSRQEKETHFAKEDRTKASGEHEKILTV